MAEQIEPQPNLRRIEDDPVANQIVETWAKNAGSMSMQDIIFFGAKDFFRHGVPLK